MIFVLSDGEIIPEHGEESSLKYRYQGELDQQDAKYVVGYLLSAFYYENIGIETVYLLIETLDEIGDNVDDTSD